jgi:hypothetical protein
MKTDIEKIDESLKSFDDEKYKLRIKDAIKLFKNKDLELSLIFRVLMEENKTIAKNLISAAILGMIAAACTDESDFIDFDSAYIISNSIKDKLKNVEFSLNKTR